MSPLPSSSFNLFSMLVAKPSPQQQQRNYFPSNRMTRSSSSSSSFIFLCASFLFLFFLLNHSVMVESLTFSKRFLGNNCTTQTYLRDCGEELICDPLIGKCTFCTNTTQCTSMFGSMNQCRRSIFGNDFANYQNNYVTPQGSNVQAGICYHKDLFPRFSYLDAISTVFSFLGSVLASVAGIGGGGVIVPLLEAAGQFPPQLAVPISKTMIFGAAISNFIALSLKRHPHADRPLINYDVTLLLQPMSLIGVLVGVLFNTMFPAWLMVLLSAIILTIMTITTTIRAVQMWKSESASRSNHLSNHPSSSDAHYTQINETESPQSDSESETTFDRPKNSTPQPGNSNILETSLLDEDQLEKIEQEKIEQEEKQRYARKLIHEEKGTPFMKLFILVLCWIIVFALTIMRGGHGAPSVLQIPYCSPWYWVLFSLMFPIMIFITILVAVYLLKKHQERQALVGSGYKFVQGDIRYTLWTVSAYPFFAGFSGLVAGLLGVGGGMIKGPLLLALGVDPLVASATASFMILFTASISSIQFVILGTLPLDYGLWFFVFGLLAGMVGQILLHFVFAKKRKSLVVFCVALIIFISTLCMTGFGIYNAVIRLQNNMYMGFHSPC
ncbi:hypothetical protein C9374_005359 [Naegleria lovaniensis]|uniref:Sulfite exporter TauE/SafE family protein n=1 Tax=Naegleria lovaniensis TaxID=51637 RepID=A0AA88KIF7_NAELO|nr:uncharacterized protein C9374_005359 [Naegleria lovaniensis]KAG2382157.1 hypothetical protein C9374_005359 [Naegleria lovaniensis]